MEGRLVFWVQALLVAAHKIMRSFGSDPTVRWKGWRGSVYKNPSIGLICLTVLKPNLHFVFLSGAGTSGGELEEESWQPPDPELTQKLIAQIEYYLSDENLEHDAFLLKHVRRNKLGFVSVKLLTSFKKVGCEHGSALRIYHCIWENWQLLHKLSTGRMNHVFKKSCTSEMQHSIEKCLLWND